MTIQQRTRPGFVGTPLIVFLFVVLVVSLTLIATRVDWGGDPGPSTNSVVQPFPLASSGPYGNVSDQEMFNATMAQNEALTDANFGPLPPTVYDQDEIDRARAEHENAIDSFIIP